MKVLKFGGTSVGTASSLRNVKSIVESIGEPAIVVVSALGGLTDKLILTAGKAAANDLSYREEMEGISNRHYDIIKEVVDEEKQSSVKEKADKLLEELKRIYDGVALIQDLSQKTLDHIVSFGERLSSEIVTAMITGAIKKDSLQFIKTEKWFDKNIADHKLTESLIKENFSDSFKFIIVPGFISTDKNTGEITNLGRGGSDFTGALIAAALDADILEIWTDVDGFMTADPRVVKDAVVLDHLTFVESMDLCTFGAKVIYPPTIYPVFHKNIPIKILNTFNPKAPGTLIDDKPEEEAFVVKGVSSLKDTALITIPLTSEISSEDVRKRTFNTLTKKGVKIFPVMMPNPDIEFSFGISGNDINTVETMLSEEFAPELNSGSLGGVIVKSDLAMIAVVGANIRTDFRLTSRIGHSLRREGINVDAVSKGNSDSSVTFMLPAKKAEESVRIIHSLIFRQQ